jgi:hypothetical protein
MTASSTDSVELRLDHFPGGRFDSVLAELWERNLPGFGLEEDLVLVSRDEERIPVRDGGREDQNSAAGHRPVRIVIVPDAEHLSLGGDLGAAEGEVDGSFLELLRIWRLQDAIDRQLVHGGRPAVVEAGTALDHATGDDDLRTFAEAREGVAGDVDVGRGAGEHLAFVPRIPSGAARLLPPRLSYTAGGVDLVGETVHHRVREHLGLEVTLGAHRFGSGYPDRGAALGGGDHLGYTRPTREHGDPEGEARDQEG